MAETATATKANVAIGDRVVYPNQGLCKVTSIEQKEIAGQSLKFVMLERDDDGAKVMVPEAKLFAVGVRRLAPAQEVGKVWAFFSGDSKNASLDWKVRARTNTDRMTQGGILGLAEIIKELLSLSDLRPLPPKERTLYHEARRQLIFELAASMGAPEADVEDTIDSILVPVGKDRPKRTVEEFRENEDDILDLGDDLLGLGAGELDPDVESSEDAASTEESADDEADEDEKPAKKPEPKKPKAAPLAAKGLGDLLKAVKAAGKPEKAEKPEKKVAAKKAAPKAAAKPEKKVASKKAAPKPKKAEKKPAKSAAAKAKKKK